MSQKIIINNQSIGIEYSPYVIAELSANHNGSLENAIQLINLAKEAGASAVKIQTYKPDTITLNHRSDEFMLNDGLWKGRSLYELYEWAHTPWEWHQDLFDHAKKSNITLFSSPFDRTAVDLLEKMNAPAYKIASFEIIDIDLIKYVAQTKKPMIISTGLASIEEIEEAVAAAKSSGCTELAVLHCVSGYPAPASDYNLRTILDMRKRFGLVTGLSDHTLGIATAVASIALGASVVEKHFTLSRANGGPDDSFSLEPSEFKSLCDSVKVAWSALGEVDYSRKSSEIENIKFRRSVYFIQDLKAGDVISKDHVRSVRPGYGLSPKYLENIVGNKVTEDVKKNTPVLDRVLLKKIH
jgi:N-acetylneuraminate synthase